jgi:CheY-like chemotaxis protein
VRAKATAGGGRVLVVDDDADVRGVLDHMLRMKGYDVIVVASGEEAVAMYRTLSGVVDLVTLDLCMPGIDGYETFRQLRSIRADARVILCSGSPDSRRVERALADGAFGFIRKPFTASQVLTMVDAAIGHKADCTPSPQSARARSSNR